MKKKKESLVEKSIVEEEFSSEEDNKYNKEAIKNNKLEMKLVCRELKERKRETFSGTQKKKNGFKIYFS